MYPLEITKKTRRMRKSSFGKVACRYWESWGFRSGTTIVFDGSSAREKSIRGFETTLGLLHSRLDAVLPHHAYGLVVYLTVLVALLLLPGFVNRVAAINKMKRAKEWLETLVFAIAVAISFSFFTVVKFSNDEQIASYLARFAPIKDQNLLPLSLTSTEINHQHEIARAVISCAMSMDDRGKDALRSLFQTIRHDVRFAEQGAVAYVLGRSAATTAPIPEKIAPLSEESKAEILVVARDALEVASGAAFAAAIGASGYELSGLAKEYFRGVVEGLSHRFSSGETLARGSDLAIRMAISALKMANTKAGEIRDYVLSGSETLSDNKKKYEAELHERLGGKETSKSILEKLISRIRR